MPPLEGVFLIFLAAVALSYVYAFVRGFTDAANAIATAVGRCGDSGLGAFGEPPPSGPW